MPGGGSSLEVAMSRVHVWVFLLGFMIGWALGATTTVIILLPR